MQLTVRNDKAAKLAEDAGESCHEPLSEDRIWPSRQKFHGWA
jgi:hypothetical protein